MSNYNTLKTSIEAVIKQNGNNEITGTLLQQALLAMVNSLGVGYQYVGIATPATDPGTPDQNVFYLASRPGTYANFGDSFTLKEGDVVILSYNGSWELLWVSYAGRFFDPHIYSPQTRSSEYENCFSEIWFNPKYIVPNSYYSLWSFSDGNKMFFGLYRGAAGSSDIVFYGTNIDITNVQNGQILELKITNAGASGIPVGTTVGYVIFNDIATFKANTSGSNYTLLNMPFVTNIGNAITILEQETALPGYTYMGNAIPSTNPGTPTQPVFYVASVPGTYNHFGSPITLKGGDTVIFKHNGSWSVEWVAFSGRFYQPILYKEETLSLYYEDCFAEIWFNPEYVPYGYNISMWSYGESQKNMGVICGTDGVPLQTPYWACFGINIDNVQDGELFELKSTLYSGVPIGTIVGYVIFRDVEKFKLRGYGQSVHLLNIPFVTNVGNSKQIMDYLYLPIPEQLSIQIPNVVYAVVGTELNIWNDTVSLSVDKGLQSPANYHLNWTCSKGIVMQRGFRFTPGQNDVGDVNCTCQLYDMQYKLIATKTFTIRVLAKNALAAAKNIVYFGDSTGRDAAIALYANFANTDKFTGTAPTMWGMKGTTPKYEAVGGYRWADYATAGRRAFRCQVSGVGAIALNSEYTNNGFTWTVVEVNVTSGTGNILITKNDVGGTDAPQTNGTLVPVGSGDSIPYTAATLEGANPLWNANTNSLDVALYRSRLGMTGKIDAVSFQLGLNAAETPDATIKQYITALYDAFIADNPNCIFILGLVTSAGNTLDGYGANYGASYNAVNYLRDYYRERELYLSLQNDAHFTNLRIATPHLSLDRYFGYQFGVRNISQRFNGLVLPDDLSLNAKEIYHTNWVHPAGNGYGQMADAFFAAYIAALTE